MGNIQKALWLKKSLILFVLVVINFGNTALAVTQIGTGSVTGTGVFDSAIFWDDNFPGTASGSVSNIVIKARVKPSLNMSISATEINLGTLIAGSSSTGSLFLEIGTNAKSGVFVSARSGSGGLTNLTDSAIKIQDNQDVGFDDFIDESYTFLSIPNAVDDAIEPTFVATGLASTEVNNNTSEYIIYTTNEPEATNGVDDVEFVVSAISSSETPAGDYEDTVTFTVTGNF